MSRYLTSSVAATALIALLSGPVLAQEAAPAQSPAPAVEAPAAPAEAAAALPQVLRDAGLTDVTREDSRRGQRISGKLPDGTVIEARLDDKGDLRGVRARKAALPAALIDLIVPQPVRSQQIYGELKQIDAIFINREGVMLAGKDAQSNAVRAAFAEDGTLLRFGRGEDRGRGDGRFGHGHDRGERGEHKGRDAGRGDHGMKMPHDAGMMPHEGAHPGDRDGAAAPAPAPLAPDQIRANLTEAGYTRIGQILQQGPITIAQATNPEGEAVLIELGPQGEVVRELNR